MSKFPTTRRVLIEKTIDSINQLQCFLECELVDSIIYKDETTETLFFVKDDCVLLEAQYNPNGIIVNPIMVKNLNLKKEINEYIVEDIFQIYDNSNLKLKLFINYTSSYDYVMQYCKKTE